MVLSHLIGFDFDNVPDKIQSTQVIKKSTKQYSIFSVSLQFQFDWI